MISIIIPIYNEEANIKKLIPYMQDCIAGYDAEIIICDGGSTDNSVETARSLNVKVVTSNQKGRALQMNIGASVAKHDTYYFVHADSVPPSTFCNDIIAAKQSGYEIGRYRTKFEGNKWLLKLNAFFTRFDWYMCYGGDQTLYITRSLFKKVNGFNENFLIMEEYDLVTKAKQFADYKIFKKTTLVSVRKYENNSWFEVQKANYKTLQLFKQGIPQANIVAHYKKLLNGIK